METDSMEAGVELDAAVAEEVMGWKLLNRRQMGWGRGPPVFRTGDADNPTHQNWHPSTDWSAAGEVLQGATPFGSLSWSVHRFHSSAGTDHEWRADCGHVSAHAPTGPLAICLAALKAVRAQKSSSEPSTPQ